MDQSSVVLNVDRRWDGGNHMGKKGAAANLFYLVGGLKLMRNGDLVDGLTAIKKLKNGFITPAIPLPVKVVRKQE
jgi:hypothetical protein